MDSHRLHCAFSLAIIFFFLILLVQENVEGRSLPRPKSCPPLRLQNGVVKLRSKGRVARFICLNGFKPFGAKSLTCVSGRWEGSTPVCARTGCSSFSPPNNGGHLPRMNGAVLNFYCSTGFRLSGPALLYCNGVKWNGTSPKCEAENTEPDLSCDFEAEDLCGWNQNPTNVIDWMRHRFSTPSGHVGTGPTYDRTRGPGQDGYYMYIETSGLRAVNGSSRLISPVFPPIQDDTCFIFWYHMYGASTGSLNVYQMSESSNVSTLKPLFSRSGEQGRLWLKGLVRLNATDEPFQVIVEAVPGRGYLGDTAIDDVSLANGTDCVEPAKQSTAVPAEPQTGGGPQLYDDSQSCRHRCSADPSPNSQPANETPIMVTCDCHVTCWENNTCCPDYSTYCVLAKVSPPAVAPTYEYRTIATVHYIPLSPPLPPARAANSSKTGDVTRSNLTTTSSGRGSPDVVTKRNTPPVTAQEQQPLGVSNHFPWTTDQSNTLATEITLPQTPPTTTIQTTKLAVPSLATTIQTTKLAVPSLASTIQTNEPIISPPATTIQTNEPIISPPATTIQTNEPIISPPATTIQTNEPIISPPATTIQTNEPIVSHPATTIQTNEPIVSPPAITIQTNEPIVPSPATTIQTNEPIVPLPATTILTNEPIVPPPATTIQTNEPIVPLPATTIQTNESIALPPATTIQTNEPIVTPPTTTTQAPGLTVPPPPQQQTTQTFTVPARTRVPTRPRWTPPPQRRPPTTSPTTKTTTRDKMMFYPKKDADTNYILKKEHLNSKSFSGRLWQQPQTAPQWPQDTTSPFTIVGIVGGVALLLVAVGVVGVAVNRRRGVSGRARDLSDDSDVRFLTADEVLDFSLARPEDEDSGL